MSNLLKQCYVVDSAQGMRIINSNSRMDERMRQLGTPLHIPREESVELPVTEDAQHPQIDVEQIKREAEEAARQEAEQITDAARREAEEILAQAKVQAESLCEEQKLLGYQEGARQKEEELEQKSRELDETFRQRESMLTETYEEKLSHMEEDIVDALITVFDKVFKIHYEDQRQILFALVMNTLSDVEPGDRIRIRTNESDRITLEQNMDKLEELTGHGVTVELVHDKKLSDGQCQIETSYGVFDCSVDTELDNLMKDIRSLI